MRIVAGSAKGARIFAPKGRDTRPTSDRVREAVFAIVASVEGMTVLDLFAGSGALGLEALSRGAASATFVESDRAALEAIDRNLEKLGLQGARIVRGDAVEYLAKTSDRYDVVFIDPPYEKDDKDAYRRVTDRVNTGLRKWPGGMFAVWYPLKDRLGFGQIREGYGGDNAPTLAVEFLRTPIDGVALAGSGLIIANPPYGIEPRLTELGRELGAAFGAPKATLTVDWWIPET